MRYKRAWEATHAMNNFFDELLVLRTDGGAPCVFAAGIVTDRWLPYADRTRLRVRLTSRQTF